MPSLNMTETDAIQAKKENILVFLYVFTFLMVIWAPTTNASTLSGDLLKMVTRIGYFVLAFVIGIAIFALKEYKVSVFNVQMILCVIIAFCIKKMWVYDKAGGSLSSLLLCSLFAIQSDMVKKKTFVMIKHCLLAMSVIGIIFYLSFTLNLGIPYRQVDYYSELKHGVWYIDYYYCCFLYLSSVKARLCGLFNEPGWFGTFLGFYLCSERMNLKRISNVIILIAGVLTFSMAFFTIITIAYLAFNLNNIKGYLKIALFALIYFFLCQLETGTDAIDSTIQAINLTDTSFLSRTTEDFDALFDKIYYSNNIIFGMGSGYVEAIVGGGNLSIRTQLVEYGIVGITLLYLPILCLFVILVRRKKTAMVFVFCIAASLYQRPCLFEVSNWILTLSGIVFLTDSSKCHINEYEGHIDTVATNTDVAAA